MHSTAGQIVLNEALPEDLRDYNRVLDKKGLAELLRQAAVRHPRDYPRISRALSEAGWRAAQESGGYGFGLQHLQKTNYGRAVAGEITTKLQKILDDDTLSDAQREAQIIKLTGGKMKDQQEKVFAEALAAKNPLALQVLSGARGSKTNLSALLGSDLLYTDNRDRVLPVPVLHSYSEGLTPAEYWAGSYGARKGVINVKLDVAKTGFFCLARGTLVRMADFSEKPIEKIKVGDRILGADKTGVTFPVTVTARFRNGKKPLYRFNFRFGSSRTKTLSIVATADHKALLRHIQRHRPRKRPHYKTVTIDVATLGSCNERYGKQKSGISSHSLLPPQGFDDRTYGYREDLAWLFGLLIGDGGLTTTHIGFSCGEPLLALRVKRELARFGFLLRKKKNAAYEYAINDKQRGQNGVRNRLTSRLRDLDMWGRLAHEKHIPDAVWSWDNYSVAAFIRGIFDTDGSVGISNNSTYPQPRIGMTAEAVVYGVQRLLAERFGIYSQVCRGNNKGRLCGSHKQYVAKHDAFHLVVADATSVKRFAEKIGFCSPAKQAKFAKAMAGASSKYDVPFSFHYLNRQYVGISETFDLEVDHPDHLFVLANGAIVSNSKKLSQAAHRLVVEDLDAPPGEHDPASPRGLPVPVTDPDNEGALLAHETGPYPRNTVLTPRILHHLQTLGHPRILVRSPITGTATHGGVYARDVGVREQGVLPGRGEFPGIAAAQAVSEPISQSTLGSKHSGGVAGEAKTVSGFDWITSLIDVPKTFPGGAAHAQADGTVGRIVDAPAGGQHVYVGGVKHYVPAGFKLLVQPGQNVEAGDVLSEGVPNPAEIVQYKGIGEGRRYFVHAFNQALNSAGIKAHRRNIELISRGLIDHVRLTGEVGHWVPDDVVPYSLIERNYAPRHDAITTHPAAATNKYLERPVLHYSIGTKLKPSVVKDLREFGIKQVTVHPQPPPFVPEMVRAQSNLQHDPDFMTRFLGSGAKTSFLDAVHRGGMSDENSSSYVPSLAKAEHFGQQGVIKSPEPGWAVKTSAVTPGIPGSGSDLKMGDGKAPGIKPLKPVQPQTGSLEHMQAESVSPVQDQRGELPEWAGGPARTPAPTPHNWRNNQPAAPSSTPAPVAAPASPASPATPAAAPDPDNLWFGKSYQPSGDMTGNPLFHAAMQYAPPQLRPLAMLGGLDWNALGTLTSGPRPDEPIPQAPPIAPPLPLPAVDHNPTMQHPGNTWQAPATPPASTAGTAASVGGQLLKGLTWDRLKQVGSPIDWHAPLSDLYQRGLTLFDTGALASKLPGARAALPAVASKIPGAARLVPGARFAASPTGMLAIQTGLDTLEDTGHILSAGHGNPLKGIDQTSEQMSQATPQPATDEAGHLLSGQDIAAGMQQRTMSPLSTSAALGKYTGRMWQADPNFKWDIANGLVPGAMFRTENTFAAPVQPAELSNQAQNLEASLHRAYPNATSFGFRVEPSGRTFMVDKPTGKMFNRIEDLYRTTDPQTVQQILGRMAQEMPDRYREMLAAYAK